MSKWTFLAAAGIGLLLLSGCGGPQVGEAEVRSYVEQVTDSDNITIDAITDLATEPGETDRDAVVTCTVATSSPYCHKKQNWTIDFEQFDGHWTGVDYSLGYDEIDLYQGLSEEDLESQADLSKVTDHFVWISPSQSVTVPYTLSWSDYQCDLEAGITSVVLCKTSDYGGYTQNTYYTVSSTWNNQKLIWMQPVCDSVPFQSDDPVIYMDVTGHYDFEANDGYHYVFDVLEDDEGLCMKNLERSYRGDNIWFKPEPYSADRVPVEWNHYNNPEKMSSYCEVNRENLGLQICYGTLYFDISYTLTPIATIEYP